MRSQSANPAFNRMPVRLARFGKAERRRSIPTSAIMPHTFSAPVLTEDNEIIAEFTISDDCGKLAVVCTPFINEFAMELTPEQASFISTKLQNRDWEGLDKFHPEILPWYCRLCNKNYPEAVWRVFPRFEEDGWLDSYRGQCPYGHERMIAD